jgi:hypothetical protein
MLDKYSTSYLSNAPLVLTATTTQTSRVGLAQLFGPAVLHTCLALEREAPSDTATEVAKASLVPSRRAVKRPPHDPLIWSHIALHYEFVLLLLP